MVPAAHNACKHKGCSFKASFGARGAISFFFCGYHTRDGHEQMVEWRECMHVVDGAKCGKQASFGWAENEPIYCSPHAVPGSHKVVSKKCSHQGCDTIRPQGGLCQEHNALP